MAGQSNLQPLYCESVHIFTAASLQIVVRGRRWTWAVSCLLCWFSLLCCCCFDVSQWMSKLRHDRSAFADRETRGLAQQVQADTRWVFDGVLITYDLSIVLLLQSGFYPHLCTPDSRLLLIPSSTVWKLALLRRLSRHFSCFCRTMVLSTLATYIHPHQPVLRAYQLLVPLIWLWSMFLCI